MQGTWAKLGGVDLHLDLSGTRVRAGLESALRDAIRVGRLRPGTRLPSSRALAADLGVARNTVAEVYSQLVAEGWLTAQTGAGTSVAHHRPPAPGAAVAGGAAMAPGAAMAAVAARPAEPVPRYDLRAGVPDLSAFPRHAWFATVRKVLAAAPDHLLGYPDPRGLPQLRTALADYLARARGVTADPAHIVIYAGTASKSLAPSLRLGWLVVPPRLLDPVTAELAAGPSALDQLTLAEFITSGGYDRQIRRARIVYRRRRDRLAAALHRRGLRVTGIAAGMHAVLELSGTSLERAALARAGQHGLAIEGLGSYRAGRAGQDNDDHQGRAGLVIGYGRPPEHAYTTALARLCAILPDFR
jgi:DNA-binding transcriptional MocR family regulator